MRVILFEIKRSLTFRWLISQKSLATSISYFNFFAIIIISSWTSKAYLPNILLLSGFFFLQFLHKWDFIIIEMAVHDYLYFSISRIHDMMWINWHNPKIGLDVDSKLYTCSQWHHSLKGCILILDYFHELLYVEGLWFDLKYFPLCLVWNLKINEVVIYAFFLFEYVCFSWLWIRLTCYAYFHHADIWINYTQSIICIQSQQRSTYSNKKYALC